MHVVAAAIVHDGRILACRRRTGIENGGQWEFPGGKIAPGETPEDAIVREIKEELGVGIQVGMLIERSTTRVGERVIDLRTYSARFSGEVPTQSSDHDVLRWMMPRELQRVEWSLPDRSAVAKLS